MNKPQEAIIKVDFPAWRSWVKVLVTDNVFLSIQKRYSEHTEDDCIAMCMHVTANPSCSLLVIPRDVSPGIVAHESWHAIYRMLNGLDAKLDNETVAYHLGYLVDRIDRFLATVHAPKKRSN
jgi:hypothetical protein